MLESIQKKIKNIITKSINLFKNNLAYIVFIGISLQVLLYLHRLPYINLVTNSSFYSYMFVFVWIVSLWIFRSKINSFYILVSALAVFILSVPMTLLGIVKANDALGFIAYVFLFTYIIRKVKTERKILRDDL